MDRPVPMGYDMEVPTVRSLIVDAGTLSLMLGGSFRPFQKYDQVLFQAVEHTDGQAAFQPVPCLPCNRGWRFFVGPP